MSRNYFLVSGLVFFFDMCFLPVSGRACSHCVAMWVVVVIGSAYCIAMWVQAEFGRVYAYLFAKCFQVVKGCAYVIAMLVPPIIGFDFALAS